MLPPHQFCPSYEIRLFLTPPNLVPQTRGPELPLLETGDMQTSLASICSKWATRGRRIPSFAAESSASSPASFALPISPHFLPQIRTLRRPTCVVDPIPTFVVRISCEGKQIVAQVSLGPLFDLCSEEEHLLLPSTLKIARRAPVIMQERRVETRHVAAVISVAVAFIRSCGMRIRVAQRGRSAEA